MHLIWDWNGTLFDDLHIVVDAVNASLLAIGASVQIDEDGYRDHYRRPVRGFYDAMLRRPVTDSEWATINTRFHDVYQESLHLAGPSHDAHMAADEVTRRNYTQSILSMWTHELLLEAVERHGLAHNMVAVRGADAAGGDPKAELLRRHLEEIGPSATGKVVIVGDTFDDAVAATEVGVEAVFYDGGSHHRPELEATGTPVADSLLDAIEIAAQL